MDMAVKSYLPLAALQAGSMRSFYDLFADLN